MNINCLIRLLKDLQGQSVVLFTLLLPVFIGAIGIAIDIGWVVYNKSKLDYATDLAVFSGAQFLPESKSEAKTSATVTFQENFSSTSSNLSIKLKNAIIGIEGLCTENSKTSTDMCNVISIDSSDIIPLYFMQFLGKNSVEITSHASALIESLHRPSSIIPLGLKPGVSLEYGDEVVIWGKGGDGDDLDLITNLSGNFGLVDPTNNGSMDSPSDLNHFIENNYVGKNKSGINTGMPEYGSLIYTVTGSKGSNVVNAFEKRVVNGFTGATIIIVDWENALKSGRTQVPVLGYAYFTDLKVKKGKVTGTFSKLIDIKGVGSSTTPYEGEKVINLIE
jgi:hypothetical protein